MASYVIGAAIAGVILLAGVMVLVHLLTPKRWAVEKRAGLFLGISLAAITLDYLGGGSDDLLIFTPIAAAMWWLYRRWLRKRAIAAACSSS